MAGRQSQFGSADSSEEDHEFGFAYFVILLAVDAPWNECALAESLDLARNRAEDHLRASQDDPGGWL